MTAKPVLDNAHAFVGYRGVGADITDKRQAEERISYLACYDPVTRLPNRFSFHQHAEKAVRAARAHATPVGLLCLDLDHFKSVNDTLGHPIGDELLAAVGECLKGCASDGDVVARLGGDEFAILSRSPSQPQDSIELARRILGALHVPMTLEHSEIAITASIGIAVAPIHADQADQLLKRADLALYQAKSEGRRTYRVFQPGMEDKARRRHRLEIGLRSALKRGELRLVFQPQLDLATGGIAGCEALLRWDSSEWGTVSPSEFIPVAEETGLIVPIGEWVLREAVREACRWPASVKVAVNLSPVQFRNRRLHATVIHALAQSGLPPGRLDLEITESTFIESTGEIAEILQSLRGLGVGVALDDFGSGYSSLNYLRRFPFDKIKIDKSFVDEIGIEEGSTAIVRTIIALAGALGMSTVAEGVETTEQLELLRELGCQQVQGYVFSRARSPADITAMLELQRDAGKPERFAAS
jgi:diguanylate cyclase (GGDEF)-like protein